MSTELTQTTLAGAITAGQTQLPVASTTGMSAPTNNFAQYLYVIDPDTTKGELMAIVSVPSSTQVVVSRLDQFKTAHATGSLVLIGTVDQSIQQAFQEYDPSGAVAAAAVQISPWVNAVNGNQWVRGTTGTWVPGWNNPSSISGATATVASAAGTIIPSGRLFHVTGTEAITGFVNASMIGFTGGSFTIIPDAIFTWTTADNIGLAGTAVVGRALTFTWDSTAAKWWPSYV